MDINHIELPLPVIVDLYHKSLIDSDGPTGPSPAKPQPISTGQGMRGKIETWTCLGNNQKHILIMVNYDSVLHIPDKELELLTTMLMACQLSLSDVVIINRNNHPTAGYKELLEHFKSRVILLFAIEPLDIGLPVSFPHFQVQNFSDNSFLYSPSLSELEQDKLLKSRLWLCLKRIFGI